MRLLLYFKSPNIIIMNQLFTFNSEQFTSSLKPALAKRILPIEDSYLRRKQQEQRNGILSKRRIKRYQQIVQANPRQVVAELMKEDKAQGQQKDFVTGQFSKLKFNIEPMTVKLFQKRQDAMFRAKNKRCNSEMSINNNQQAMLFTFYPNQKTLPQKQQTEIKESQNQNSQKLIGLRSLSMKNPPLVSYPMSNKILPRVFRLKSGAEQEIRHFKRLRHISEIPLEQQVEKTIRKQSIIEEIRNMPIKKSQNKTPLKHHLERIKIPLKNALNIRKVETSAKRQYLKP